MTSLGKRALRSTFPTGRNVRWLLLFVIGATLLAACVAEDDLTPDQRAYSLDRQLMCPVCDGQTIDQSHAPIAQDMKEILREQISEGQTNQDIRDYFVARYGQSVLAAPEASGFNLLVWLMPGVIAGGGALIVVLVLRNMRRKGLREAAAQKPSQEAEAHAGLKTYLDRVDADIGYTGAVQAEGAAPDGQESGEG